MDISTFLNDIKKYKNNIGGKNSPFDIVDNLGGIINCPVFIVNLERSTYRRKFILNYLAKLGIQGEVITAVEGSKLDLDKLKEDGVYSEQAATEAFSRQLSMPEIGCSLSHINIYKRMVSNNVEQALIIEDDVMFDEGVSNTFKNILKNIPDDWEIIQFYYHNCKDYEELSENIARFNSKKCLPNGSLGYVIKKSAAVKMLGNVFPVRYPADSMLGRSPRWGVVMYGSIPQLMVLNNIFPTEIHQRKTIFSKLKYNVKQLIVSGLSRLFSQ